MVVIGQKVVVFGQNGSTWAYRFYLGKVVVFAQRLVVFKENSSI